MQRFPNLPSVLVLNPAKGVGKYLCCSWEGYSNRESRYRIPVAEAGNRLCLDHTLR